MKESNSEYRMVTAATENVEEINIKDVFVELWRRKFFILFMMFICAVLAAIYAINVPPKYKTEALIQVANQSNSGVGSVLASSSLSSFFWGGYGTAQPSQIETALLKSRFILQPTVESQNLNIAVTPRYFPIFGRYLARKYNQHAFMSGTLGELAKPVFGFKKYAWGGEKVAVSKFEIPVSLYGKSFSIVAGNNGYYKLYSPDGDFMLQGQIGKLAQGKINKNFTIKLLVEKLHANPGVKFYLSRAASEQVSQKLGKVLTISDMSSDDTSQTGVLSLGLQGNNQFKLAQILDTIVKYSVEDNIKNRSKQAEKTLQFLYKQLPDIKKSLDQAEQELNMYRSKTSILDVSSEGSTLLEQVVDVEKNLDQLKLKKTELLQEFTTKHPFVIAVNGKLMKLAAVLQGLKDRIKQLPLKEQKAIQLEREVKVKNQLYVLLLDRIQQLKMIKAGTIGDIQVLGKATYPTRLPNHKRLMLLGGAFLGFMLAIILIFIRKMLSSTVVDPGVVEEDLGLPSCAIVPYSKKQDRLGKRMKQKGAAATQSSHLLSEIAPRDLAVESFRSLRTTLQFMFSEAKNNIVSVMGASPSVGKSFVSANLAYVCSEGGKRVLLIDADLRRGRLYKYVSAARYPGLSDVLRGEEQAADVVQKISDNFDFMSSGRYPENIGKIFLEERVSSVLESLSESYDIVLVDTPPVLSLADSVLISKYSSINLLLVGGGKDTIGELRYTIKRISKVGAKIDGLIFNNITRQAQAYHSYYYGYKYY